MKSLLTFGLPNLGTAMVLIAILNSVFALQSLSNFLEMIVVLGRFSVRKDSFALGSVIVSFLLTTYLWIAVIFKGRSGHLSIWIAGNLIILLLHIVISTWNLLAFLSTKDSLYWRKLWNLIVSSIAFEVYLIAIAIKAANVMWQNVEDQGTRSSPVAPIGFKLKKFINFYVNNLQLTAQAFIILDVIFSSHALITLRIPEVIFESKDFGLIPGGTAIFVLLEDTIIRILRVALGIVAVWFIVHKQSDKNHVIKILISHIVLISFSLLIYLLLFGSFEELSVTDRFYQINFTFDIIFRLLIVYCLVTYVEKPRLMEASSNANWDTIDYENSMMDETY